MKIDIILILKIVKVIIEIILQGGSEASAISQAASKFGLSESEVAEIWKKHGR